MTDREFLARCAAVGLTPEEARQALARAKAAGHADGDPYMLAWVHAGASAKAQRLFEASLQRFEASEKRYAQAIANSVFRTSTPQIEAAISKAIDAALASPKQLTAKTIDTLALVVLIAGTFFHVGMSISTADDAFWSDMSSRSSASLWKAYILHNPSAAEEFEACLNASDKHNTDTEGLYCDAQIYVDRTFYRSSAGQPMSSYTWLLQVLFGAAAMHVGHRLKPLFLRAVNKALKLTRDAAS